jgi:hypothetical protein
MDVQIAARGQVQVQVCWILIVRACCDRLRESGDKDDETATVTATATTVAPY